MIGYPRPARGHMPFPGHRTCAEWGPEAFADALAEHGSIARAARSAGMTLEEGKAEFRRICKSLGAAA